MAVILRNKANRAGGYVCQLDDMLSQTTLMPPYGPEPAATARNGLGLVVCDAVLGWSCRRRAVLILANQPNNHRLKKGH